MRSSLYFLSFLYLCQLLEKSAWLKCKFLHDYKANNLRTNLSLFISFCTKWISRWRAMTFKKNVIPQWPGCIPCWYLFVCKINKACNRYKRPPERSLLSFLKLITVHYFFEYWPRSKRFRVQQSIIFDVTGCFPKSTAASRCVKGNSPEYQERHVQQMLYNKIFYLRCHFYNS